MTLRNAESPTCLRFALLAAVVRRVELDGDNQVFERLVCCCECLIARSDILFQGGANSQRPAPEVAL